MSEPYTGLAFGLLLAAVFAVALVVAVDVSTAAGVFLLAVGLMQPITCWLLWSRLGFRLTAAGLLAVGAVFVATGLALLADSAAAMTAVPLLPLVVGVAGGLFLLDRRTHRDAWERWRESMHEASFVDLLLARHIPKTR